MKNILLLFLAVLLISGVSYAQSGEGVACIPWAASGTQFSCSAGLSCATYGPGDLTGRCLDLQNDGMNCGAISRMCQAGQICSGGSCADDSICDPTVDSCYGDMPPLLAYIQPFRLKRLRLSLPL